MRGKNISFKRKLKVKTDCCEFQADTIPTNKWTQTDFLELYSILPDVINVLKEMQRYDDFVTVTKCIRERILTENIAFHLLLDIGNVYSKYSINAVRYSNETLEFWLTVQKLFKGKGVNFVRGFKAQGLNTMNESLSSISPLDCRINLSVSSNPTLLKETSKYTLDPGSPGLLNITLDAFTNVNTGKYAELSIDGKKLVIGLGDKGAENVGGFEVYPTLMERKNRLKTETDNLTIITSRLKETIVDGVEKVDKMEDDFNGLMKQSLLISITHMSRGIKELR